MSFVKTFFSPGMGDLRNKEALVLGGYFFCNFAYLWDPII